MTTVAQGLVILFGLWLIAVSGLMLARPHVALRYLARAASTDLINYGEITLRMIAGLALVACADLSRFPQAFRVAGWVIAATSAVLLFVPRRWHALYAVWWSEKLTPGWVRVAAPFSLGVGILVIYAVV